MKYKMLVLDVDGTLLNDQHQISDRNKKALLKAQSVGIKVVLASGRPTPAMTAYARELQLYENDSYIISYNGGVVTHLQSNKTEFEKKLTPNQVHRLYDFCIENNAEIFTYLNDIIITETNNEYVTFEKEITRMEMQVVSSFKDTILRAVEKCIITQTPENMVSLMNKLKIAMPDMNVSMSQPFYVEIAPNNVDKAMGIDFLAKKYGFHSSEIAAVGNAGNDLTMVQYAGLGVFVANADKELHPHANALAASNNEDGVAEVIEKFLLE
jgi:Cof subfamily protein (haloacid dehalogenase superfamily)